MAFERIKKMFTRQTGRSTEPRPRVAEQRKRLDQPDPERFRVEREDAGQTYQGYVGPRGADAVEVWETYQNDPQYKGVFTFWDGAKKRGEFTR